MSVADYNASQSGSELIYGFTADGITVIDGAIDGNDARFINHSCEPNCEAISFERERIYLYAMDDIPAGAELSFDYQLGQAGGADSSPKQSWVCRCGAPKCRGNLLAPKVTL
jgi:SET domain-containing protein